MDEKDFELIATLNRTRNITKAAELLFVSQPTLSKRIAAIEHELGTAIIIRSRQGIHFTPEGEEVYRRTVEAAQQLRLMRDAIEERKNYVSGTLNAGVSMNYALYKFPAVLAKYRKLYPYVNTHIVSDYSRKLYLQILDGSLDIAVIRGEFPWKGKKILIDQEQVYAITSEQDKGKPLKELTHISRKTDSDHERKAAQWLYENNIQLDQHGIYVDNITTCVEMVKQGIGWAIVPEIGLGDFNGHKIPLFFESGEPFVRSTYLMYTDNAYALSQVEAFANIILETKEPPAFS